MERATQQILMARHHAWIAPATASLLALRLTELTSVAIYAGLALLAFRGPRFVILALLGSWLSTLANPGFFAEVPNVARYGVLFACAGAVIFHRSRARGLPPSPLTRVFVLIVGLLAVHSVIFSQIPAISLFKLTSFAIGVMTLVVAWRLLQPIQRLETADSIYLALALIVVASLPLFWTGEGFLRNGHGFQGLLNHPQAFGVTCGFVTVWTAVRLARLERPLILLVTIFAAAAYCLLRSEARTAILASLLAIMIAIPTFATFAADRLGKDGGHVDRHFPALAGGVIIATAIAGIILDIPTFFLNMLSKGGVGIGDVGEAFAASRGFLIDHMVMNIRGHFWTGIGFGVPSNPFDLVIEHDPILGLPIGAPVEKGVGPIAVLEELGALITAIFVAWLLMTARNAWKTGLSAFALLLYALFANLGEYTFFSMGGMGLLAMILMSFGMVSDQSGTRA